MSKGPPRLDDTERRARLRLARTPSIGPISFRQLLRRFTSAAQAVDGAVALARRGGRRLKLADPDAVEREWRAVEAHGATFVVLGDAGYPAALAAIEDAPPVLTVLGKTEAVASASIAIVGSRNASVAGRSMAMSMAGDLGRAGYTIVSGLARGIDAAAHQGGLATGTVAVLAGGLDRLYPPEHADLAAAIVEAEGALITEMPFGREPRGRDFPRRNRIISGLSLGVVVVEAARRSGSLITGRRAAAQGRGVFAVPGSPVDPRAEGANLLIRDGATLVTCADDVIADVAPMYAREPRPIRFEGSTGSTPEEPANGTGDTVPDDDSIDAARAIVLEALGPSPVEIDAVIRHTGVDLATVQLILLELDLAGRTQRHAGQRVSLIRQSTP